MLESICEKLSVRLRARETELEQFGWKIINRDFEQGINFTLCREDKYLHIKFEEREYGPEGHKGGPRFNMLVRDPFVPGRKFTSDEKLITAIIWKLMEKSFYGIFDIERPALSGRMRIREITVDSMVMREGKNQYYINPYVGCTVGCSFCVIEDMADLSRRIEGLPKVPWGRYLDVKMNAAEIVEKEIKKLPGGSVRICPEIADAYQPSERHYRLTRQCLNVLLKGGFTPLIMTRARRVLEDLELLRAFKKVFVGFSMPTDDDRIRHIFEPGADPIEERLDALEKCHAAGLNTHVLIQPILPMNVDRLIEKISPFIYYARVDRMNRIEKMTDVYVKNGIEYAMSETFFLETKRRLEYNLHSRGIPTIDTDNYEDISSIR